MSEEIILPDDPRAATYRTDIEGWVSRKGLFFGMNERTARYDGSTHTACSKCGIATKHPYIICDKCRDIIGKEKYEARPSKVWDGKAMLYSLSVDEYFIGIEEAVEYLEDQNDEIINEKTLLEDLQLVICEPVHIQLQEELFDHKLPIDEYTGDFIVAQELDDAINTFNDAMKDVIVSWKPGKFRVDLASV